MCIYNKQKSEIYLNGPKTKVTKQITFENHRKLTIFFPKLHTTLQINY